MVKNCDLCIENAALGLRPRAVFSRPQSQFFTIRTSQPANNIYILFIKIADLAFTRLIPRTTFCSCASSPYFFKTFGSMDSYPDLSVKGIAPTHVTFSFDVWLHETLYSLTSVCQFSLLSSQHFLSYLQGELV